MSLLLANFFRYFSLKLLKSRVFWMGLVIVVTSVILMFNATSFFFKYHMMSKINNVAYAAQKGINDVNDIYKDALIKEGLEPDFLFGAEVPTDEFGEVIYEDLGTGSERDNPNNLNLNIGGSDSSYDEVKLEAEAIEGSSVLHQMNNAIVRAVSEVGQPYFDYSYVIGVNMKESNGYGGSWLPFIGADKKGLADPNFNINTWGINSITTFADVNSNYNYSRGDAKQYIGPFQTGVSYYFSGHRYTYSWSHSKFKELVASSGSGMDGNGDGKSDPFNYLDSLEALKYHSKTKYDATVPYFSVVDSKYETDILQMSVLARYVGVSNSKGTKRFASSDGPWTGYTHHEHLNPHVQLMRKAAEEYHNNGPNYQKFKELVSSTKSLNGVEVQRIVNGFYNSYGWVASGDTRNNNATATYTFPDGKTMKFTGQNVHYVFLSYWGGKVAQEAIQSILN